MHRAVPTQSGVLVAPVWQAGSRRFVATCPRLQVPAPEVGLNRLGLQETGDGIGFGTWRSRRVSKVGLSLFGSHRAIVRRGRTGTELLRQDHGQDGRGRVRHGATQQGARVWAASQLRE